ncbi:hypothetical protein [uncultured Chloroflexus sp.]|nr:hypothetical protein [uncultured Chloroflexus sp.]
MLNTGFRHLRLVAPAPFDHELIAAVAHRPEPILATLTSYTDMTSAVADVRYLVGTSDRPHPGVPWRNDVLKRDVWYTRYCGRLPSRKAWIETAVGGRNAPTGCACRPSGFALWCRRQWPQPRRTESLP